MTVGIESSTARCVVELYAHEPKSLLPLLNKYLPRSLPVIATIRENLSAPSSSTSTSGSISGRSHDEPVYATFLPGEIPDPDADFDGDDTRTGTGDQNQRMWGVVVRTHDSASPQLRLFCSAESKSGSEISTPCSVDTTHTNNGVGESGDDRNVSRTNGGGKVGGKWSEERIQEFVTSLTEAVVRIWGKEIVLGSVDSRWNKRVREVVDSEEYVECTVFLAPAYVPDERMDRELEERVGALGLEFDEAHDGDMDVIMSTCDVPRPRAYYQSRAPHTTVLRRLEEPKEAVCWSMHHADGAMGALYTLPAWRRKGLAECVVKRRIRDRHRRLEEMHLPTDSQSGSGSGSRPDQNLGQMDYCHVFRANTASEALWPKLGWTAGWGVRWILNSEVARKRGKVVLHRDNDEKP